MGEQAVDWTNITAITAVIALLSWLITVGGPKLLSRMEASQEKFVEMLNAANESRNADAKDQRTQFREELAQHRQHSANMAAQGHAAMDRLSDSVGKLEEAVEKLCTKERIV